MDSHSFMQKYAASSSFLLLLHRRLGRAAQCQRCVAAAAAAAAAAAQLFLAAAPWLVLRPRHRARRLAHGVARGLDKRKDERLWRRVVAADRVMLIDGARVRGGVHGSARGRVAQRASAWGGGGEV